MTKLVFYFKQDGSGKMKWYKARIVPVDFQKLCKLPYRTVLACIKLWKGQNPLYCRYSNQVGPTAP